MITKTVQVNKSIDPTSSECRNPIGFSVNICVDGHRTKRYFRCRHCEGCEIWRTRSIRAQIFNRIVQNDLVNQEGLLWTFGTNLKYNQDNYKVFRRYWTKLVDWIRHTYPDFVLYFRVFEAGTKGKRLHIHFVSNIWSKKSDFQRIRQKWSEITAIPKPNVNFRRVKRCSRCNMMVDFYKTKTHCGGNRVFKPVGIRSALMYLTKYLTKEYKAVIGMRHNYYWGKPLRYKWKLVKEEVIGWNYDENEPMHYERTETNGNGRFRKIGHIYGREYANRNGKYVVVGLHRRKISHYWRDVDVICGWNGYCENTVVKGINLMSYDKAYRALLNTGMEKSLVTFILKHTVMKSKDDYV